MQDINVVTEREEAPVEISTSVRRSVTPSPLDLTSYSAGTRYAGAEPKSQSTPAVAPSRDSRTASTSQAKSDTQTSRSSAAPTLKPGTSYPEVHTSSIDVDSVPEYTLPDGTKKLITDIEIDADLAEHIKPWRRPGTDITDYFNYGFDEFTWSMYTQKQKAMSGTLKEIKDQDEQFKMLMSGGFPSLPGMPPMPGMPGAGGGSASAGAASTGNGAAAGPPQGMPGPEQMMEMMNQMMMQQGTSDPGQLDFAAFMQQMQGGGAAAPPSGPAAAGQNFGGNQNWQGGGSGAYGGGGGGRGRGGGRRW